MDLAGRKPHCIVNSGQLTDRWPRIKDEMCFQGLLRPLREEIWVGSYWHQLLKTLALGTGIMLYS